MKLNVKENSWDYVNRLSIKNENENLIRFIDIHKLISFLSSSEFNFTRIDKFNDKLEAISEMQLAQELNLLLDANRIREEQNLIDRQMSYYALCWFLNHRESIAMWDLYSNSSSVALKINIKEFNEIWEYIINDKSLVPVNRIYVNRVQYIDFKSNNILKIFNENEKVLGFHKDISFEHEKEVRVLIKCRKKPNSKIDNFKIKSEKIRNIKIDLIFHPEMEEWKKDNIKKLVKNYQFENITCKNSELEMFYNLRTKTK